MRTDRPLPYQTQHSQQTDHYPTKHNTHNRQTSIPPVGFQPAFPASLDPRRRLRRFQVRLFVVTGSVNFSVLIEVIFLTNEM
jgi:hypothetical protein